MIITAFYLHLKKEHWLMIFLSFLLISSIFLISAHFAGNVGTFINLDSLIIVLLGIVISSVPLSWGKVPSLKKGLIQIFSFSIPEDKDTEVKNIFTGLSISTAAVGFCSSCQGILSVILIDNNTPILQVLSFASFTTVYALIISIFIFLPVVFRNR